MTENINTIINSDIENRVEDFVALNIWPNHIYQELSMSEAVDMMKEYFGIIRQGIDKGIVDNMSFHFRNGLYSHLTHVNQQATTVVSNKNQSHWNAFVTYLQHVSHTVDSAGLSLKVGKALGYEEEIIKVKELSKGYRNEIRHIKDASKIKEQSEQTLIQIQEDFQKIKGRFQEYNTEASEFKRKITELQSQATQIKTNVESLEAQTTKYHSSSKINSEQVQTLQERIKAFFNEIEKYKLDYIENKKHYDNLFTETRELLHENEDLRDEIKEQLKLATGNSLFRSFDTKAKKLKNELWLWGILLFLFLGCVVGLGVWITTDLKTGNITSFFYIKLVTSVPLVYGLFFANSQFSKNKNLLEEYSFKSAISLSLEAYRSLLEKDFEKYEGKLNEFLINSIERIYTSPTKNIFKYVKDDDNLLSVKSLEKVAEIFSKVRK